MSVAKCVKNRNQEILIDKGFNSESQFISFLLSFWNYQNSHYKRRYENAPKLLKQKN